MAYATRADVEEIYGANLLLVLADRDGDGTLDTEEEGIADAALDMATSQIDMYIGSRYVVPLDPVPEYIKVVCIDIAVYRMAHEHAPRTQEMRLRYEDAMRYLEGVAKGTIAVEGATEDTAGGGTDVGSSASIKTLIRC
jgi:phage gp36-like protein